MLRFKLSAPKCIPLYRSITTPRHKPLYVKTTTIHNARLQSPMQISQFHVNEIIQARKIKSKSATSQSSVEKTADDEDEMPLLKQQILMMMKKKLQKKELKEEEVEQIPQTSAQTDDKETIETNRTSKTKPHVVLIDASSLIYKSHYAHTALQNGALFGYLRYLLRLVNELKPFKNIGNSLSYMLSNFSSCSI